MASNYIYAKVKRKQNLFRVVSSDETIYELPNLVGIEYSPSTLIEDEELYKLSNFSTTSFATNFISDDLDSVNYDQINKADLKKLSYICTVQEGYYFFQVINSSLYISKKWFSIEELTLEVDKPIIAINFFADAIYDKNNDILYFKKLSVANRIFKGMDQLYREATDNETQQFLESEFLDVNSSFVKSNVSIPNRKKIALVSDVLN